MNELLWSSSQTSLRLKLCALRSLDEEGEAEQMSESQATKCYHDDSACQTLELSL